MKIVCDACGAKYSIADEKVAGKVFKIRCKKCSNIIVVRGNAEQADAAPEEPQPNKDTKVFDYAGYDSPQDAMAGEEGEWHLVIDQEQVGPMTSAEVRQRFAAGDVDADSYIWKEGFSDWERIPEVPDFADLADGGGAAAAAIAAAGEVPAEASDGGGLFGGDLGDGGGSNDLFGGGESAKADGGADLFGDASAAAGNDLFGGGESVGENTGEIQMSSEAEAQLKGQRNENSVLFSLGNLAALASDSPKPAAAVSSSSSSGLGTSNTGGSEGSGLIDIRSMASVYLADKKQPGLGATPAGSADDLPVFSQSAFESASPVLLPTNDGPDKKLLYSLIGVIGALLVAAIILVVIVLKDDGANSETVAANNDLTESEDSAPDTEEPEDGTAEPVAAASTDETEPTEPDKTEPVEASNPASAVAPPTARKPKGKDRNSKKPKSSTTSRTKPAAADPKPPRPSGGGGGCDEVTCLVDPGKACCKKFNGSSGSSSSSSSKKNSKLPENLSKGDFKAGLGKVRGRAFACGDKHSGSGKVVVKIKIGGDGRVKSASGSGGSSGLRNCVTSVVKRAKFKKTQKGATVNYPFVFH